MFNLCIYTPHFGTFKNGKKKSLKKSEREMNMFRQKIPGLFCLPGASKKEAEEMET